MNRSTERSSVRLTDNRKVEYRVACVRACDDIRNDHLPPIQRIDQNMKTGKRESEDEEEKEERYVQCG